MGNVIPLFSAIPQPNTDARLDRLHAAFGRRPFTIAQAVDVLDIPYDEARTILLTRPLCDSRFRVSSYSLGFWLIPTTPLDRAAKTWEQTYTPIVKELVREKPEFSSVEFAKRAEVPFPSAQYILSMMVKNDLLTIQALDNGGAATFTLKRKRRKIIRNF